MWFSSTGTRAQECGWIVVEVTTSFLPTTLLCVCVFESGCARSGIVCTMCRTSEVFQTAQMVQMWWAAAPLNFAEFLFLCVVFFTEAHIVLTDIYSDQYWRGSTVCKVQWITVYCLFQPSSLTSWTEHSHGPPKAEGEESQHKIWAGPACPNGYSITQPSPS